MTAASSAPLSRLRRLSATIHRGKITAEIGRQLIRWGKTDILNPTDRFAPKDYLSSVVDTDFLGVTAARVTYESGGDTVDLIWQPWFTPSRTPLLNQRWTALPPGSGGGQHHRWRRALSRRITIWRALEPRRVGI